MSLTEICGVVGIHKSKGYSILNTLQHFAFVQRSPYGKIYSLGPGLLFLSSKVLDNMDLREAVPPAYGSFLSKLRARLFLALFQIVMFSSWPRTRGPRT